MSDNVIDVVYNNLALMLPSVSMFKCIAERHKSWSFIMHNFVLNFHLYRALSVVSLRNISSHGKLSSDIFSVPFRIINFCCVTVYRI